MRMHFARCVNASMIPRWRFRSFISWHTQAWRRARADRPREVVRAHGAAFAEAMRMGIAALPNKRGKAKAATADVVLRHGPGGLTTPRPMKAKIELTSFASVLNCIERR